MPKKYFFVGIGGAGMSALARMMKARGVEISGSDLSEGEEVARLRQEGISISIGQDIELISKDTDIVVYSNALKKYASEFVQELKNQNWEIKSYPELLGELSRSTETIAIAGTHGKTTTTAMVGTVLHDLGFDPTIVLGGTLVREGTNFVAGHGKYLVVEVDEYERAFHNFYPKFLIITNIDLDHLDYYRDLADIQDAFREVAERVPEDGAVICNPNDPHIAPVVKNIKAHKLIFPQGEACLSGRQALGSELKLRFSGAHMRANAAAVLALGEFLKLPRGKVIESLNSFVGVKRRFEFIGETEKGAFVYDDYAHNPEKVRAALQGAREMYPDRRIIAVFQPHLYSRTKKLLPEFAKSFSDADEILVLPIFPSREKFDPSITSGILVEAIKFKKHFASAATSFLEAKEKILSLAGEDDIVLLIGAGDVYKLGDLLISQH